MSVALKTGFPDGITVADQYVIRFTALSPVDGSVVSGVKVSNVSVFTDSGQTFPDVGSGPFLLLPGTGA